MKWPDSHDYLDAVQNPHLCFDDPELQAGAPATDALGLPRPCSGSSADVYQIRAADGRRSWAVKCFTREVDGLRERYHAIDEHLGRLTRPGFLVDFDYQERGVFLLDRWFPIVKMDWVDGIPLNACVASLADQPARLLSFARLWPAVADRLVRARIAHGDLQHGNVLLVRAGAGKVRLKLVDYDGLWVPSLARARPAEAGHPNYQHPARRSEGHYGPTLDRFSLLCVYTALRALAVGGGTLWDRHDNGDNLLFRREDFDDPAGSALFRTLWTLDDPDVRGLAGWLALAAKGEPDDVPTLTRLVGSGQKVLPLTPERHEALDRLFGTVTPRTAPTLDRPSLTVAKTTPTPGRPTRPPAPKPKPKPKPAKPSGPPILIPLPPAPRRGLSFRAKLRVSVVTAMIWLGGPTFVHWVTETADLLLERKFEGPLYTKPRPASIPEPASREDASRHAKPRDLPMSGPAAGRDAGP